MSQAAYMTSATALVKSLISHGVDTVFGLPGVQTYALFDALNRHRDQLAYVGSRHEQGAAYMAFGYAKSTGKPGVYTVVPGPGFLNTAAALSSAYSATASANCRSPRRTRAHSSLNRSSAVRAALFARVIAPAAVDPGPPADPVPRVSALRKLRAPRAVARS